MGRVLKHAVAQRIAKMPLATAPAPGPSSALAALALAQVRSFDGDTVEIEVAGRACRARRDPLLATTVLRAAAERGERVVVEEGPSGELTVVGALRTQPTPGIEQADEYVIEARRVSIVASEELSLSARLAAVVVRAVGEVETYAERIVSRAEGVHKIVGRMLRLN